MAEFEKCSEPLCGYYGMRHAHAAGYQMDPDEKSATYWVLTKYRRQTMFSRSEMIEAFRAGKKASRSGLKSTATGGRGMRETRK